MDIKELVAKSILTQSKLPDADYVINPYIGCQFGCLYCYASFMGRFVGEPIESWGNYLYVKQNALALFEKEYAALRKTGKQPSLLLSSVTDPYQGAEKKYQLTRGILEILAQEPYLGKVSILTKSPMVIRDIDLLKKIPHSEVGLTVTTTDDKLSRYLEVHAPNARRRFETLKTLNLVGIQTYAFIGPLLPHFRLDHAQLEELIAALADTGTRSVYIEHINLKDYIGSRMRPYLQTCSEDVQNIYKTAKFEEHRKNMNDFLLPLLEKYHVELRLNKVLNHVTDK